MRADRLLVALLPLLLLTWLLHPVGGTEAAFAVSTANGGNRGTSASDWRPPVVARSVVVKSEGGLPGYVRQGGTYRVAASVTDDPSSNPPAGVGTVTGDVSALSTGATAVALPVGGSTIDGLTYTHRSALQTVRTPLAPGTYLGRVSSRDLAVPANISTATLNAVVDNTPPVNSSLLITNGGIAGRPDVNDTITFAWNEVIDPNGLVAGWTGTPTSVTVRITDGNGVNGDLVSFWDATNTTQLPLGEIALRSGSYVTGMVTYGGPGAATRSRVTWSAAAGDRFVVTLGTPNPAGSIGTNTTAATFAWTPVTGVYDRAGNPSSSTTYTETGAKDRDF